MIAGEIKAKIEAFQLPHKDAYKELDTLRKQRDIDRKEALSERVRVIRELPESKHQIEYVLGIQLKFIVLHKGDEDAQIHLSSTRLNSLQVSSSIGQYFKVCPKMLK